MSDELEKLLKFSQLNGYRFQLLKECVHRGDLVPFVGAGLSRDSGFPLWHDFVLDMGSKASVLPQVQSMLKAGDYEGALDAVHTKLGEKLTRTFIRASFGPRRIDTKQIGGAVRYLPSLARGPVVTTNYDCILECVYESAQESFDKCVIGARVDPVADVVSEAKHFLLKVHGTFDESESQLLSRSDYDKYYGTKSSGKFDPALVLPKLMLRIFGSMPLLFLGCSLTDDRTMALLDYLHRDREGAAARHFAIIEET